MRIAVLLLTLLLATACQETESTADTTATTAAVKPSIAFIDQNRVFIESEPGKKGMEMLQEMSVELQERLKALQEASEEEGLEEEERMERRLDFQKTVESAQAQMSVEQQRIVGILTEKFDELLAQYRQEHELTAILSTEVAVSYDPEADITDEIIAAFNASGVVPEAPAEAPAEGGGQAPEIQEPTDEGQEQ